MNRQWQLRTRPQGMVKDSDFALISSPVPQISDGEVLVKTLYVSCDPAMRGWLEDRRSYVPPVQIGEVMRANGVGQVVESRSADFKVGDLVQGMLGWQEYSAHAAKALRVLPPGAQPTLFLGVLGMTGLTAYFGLLDIGKPVAGETVLVSGAAGATGSIVGQIARIHGCRVIGIAGGKDKCDWLVKEARFDAAIDYKSEDVEKRVRELCPKGVNIYFDNVGGEILDVALGNLAQRARVVICGGISVYNDPKSVTGPRRYLNLLVTRSRMEGFLIFDYVSRFGEAIRELSGWLQKGELRHEEDIQVGIENAPATLRRLFEGQNRGKQILKIADPA